MDEQATDAAGCAKSHKLGLFTGHLGSLVRRTRRPFSHGQTPDNPPSAIPEPDPRKTGVTPELRARYRDIVEEPFWEIAHKCLPYTMLLIERL